MKLSLDREKVKKDLNLLFNSKTESQLIERDALMLQANYLSEIERITKDCGINRKDIALSIRTSPSYLTQVFRGDKPLNFITLAKIKRALNLRFTVTAEFATEKKTEITVDKVYKLSPINNGIFFETTTRGEGMLPKKAGNTNTLQQQVIPTATTIRTCLDMPNVPEFGFNVQRIIDVGFGADEGVVISPDDVNIGYSMIFTYDVKQSWVQFTLRADFTRGDGKLFAHGIVGTFFGINNLQSFVTEDGKDILFPPTSLETMFGIAFTHLRAILAKNLGGTMFYMYIIPLVNPHELFKTLYKLNLDFVTKMDEEAKKKAEDQLTEINAKEIIKKVKSKKKVSK